MKIKSLLGALDLSTLLLFGGNTLAANITGAGATFPYPVYAKWAEAYKTQTGTDVNDQSIGSGGRIQQIDASGKVIWQ